MDKYQLMLGTQQHILTLDSKDFTYGESCSMKYLWKENSKRGVKVVVQDAWTQKPTKVHDRDIMDIFREKEKDSIKLAAQRCQIVS